MNVDVFSTAIMVYECLYGKTPWPAQTLQQLKNMMTRDGKIKNFPRTPRISNEMKRVLEKMSIVKPSNKRPTAK